MLLWINGRTEAQHELAAWHASNLMACWTEHPPTPNKLLGREEPCEHLHAADFSSVEEFNEALEARRSQNDPLDDD